ncbi:MAG: hypothetical protein E4H10_17415, partial [Bacteroidia bacterium]
MRNLALTTIFFSISILLTPCSAQDSASVQSPDGNIAISLGSGEKLTYSVNYKGREIILPSPLGFELKGEPSFDGSLDVVDQTLVTIHEEWEPVVKSKHARILNHCNELHWSLREGSGLKRKMELYVRAYDDGVAFRYKLYRSEQVGDREITRELTTFRIPGDPNAWIVEYGGYATSNEKEFIPKKLSTLNESSLAGMPLLMEFEDHLWLAITEANIDNYPAFYVGTNGNTNQLTTKLAPLPSEEEGGSKARFDDEIYTPWRVLMVGESPGTLIESEIVQNLNEPCAIEDPSWIKPGMSAWDHWWHGEVKMEMPVIKQYIDLAAEMGWEYMLV